ncbi:hypothetical protein B0H14DRAFT_2564290 [Mycena olivaceomarginata]|nr:hypothetical protein B0H14DRAFT_2564290 [Mycena olivaceomarginata]
MSNPPDSFQIQIVGEKIKEYKIQKTGTDPKTGEPWATQWISKNLVAKDVVAVWKEKLNEVLKEWHEGSQGQRKAPQISGTSTTTMRNSPTPSNSCPEPSDAEERGQEDLSITNKRKRGTFKPSFHRWWLMFHKNLRSQGSIQALWIAEVQSSSVDGADGASSSVQVQARQSGTLGRDHPNSPNRGSDSLTLSRDDGGYRPAFGTEPGPSSDNLSHAQYSEPLNYPPQLAALEQQFDFFTNPSMHPKQSARDPWVDFLEYVQLFAFFDFLSYVLLMRRFFSYFLDVLGDVLADLEAIPEDNSILEDKWEDDDYPEIESIKPGTSGKELLIVAPARRMVSEGGSMGSGIGPLEAVPA